MTTKRKQYADDVLVRAVNRVVEGGERAANVSREESVPYRTLLQYVSRRRRGEPTVPRRRGPPPTLTPAGEQQLLVWMRELQDLGLPVRRRELLVKANDVLRALNGPNAEVSTGWYGRFRGRHPEISGSGTQMVIAAAPDDPEIAPSTTETEEQASEEEEEKSAVEAEMTPSEAAKPEVRRREVKDEDRTPSERAVLMIQKSYGDSWPAQDVVDAFDVMLDPAKARMFAVMATGELRELWLRKQLNQLRQSQQQRQRSRTTTTLRV